jgi:hypothetical protein
LSSHKLAIEVGRLKKVDRGCRKCFNCDSLIEDEFHFILKCPVYNNLRKRYIKPYYWKKPSVFKLLQLYSAQNIKDMCNLGKFIHLAIKIRDAYVQ